MSLTYAEARVAVGGARMITGSASSHYASWRPEMSVWLDRHGASDVHTREMLPKKWSEIAAKVKQWSDEKLDSALALIDEHYSSSGGSTMKSSMDGGREEESGSNSEAIVAARKLVSALVARSMRVYGAIYSALPVDLKHQADTTVVSGFAYGLWHWLETKLTERDSVGELLTEWLSMKQENDESFDAYRSRVNKLCALLTLAKEKPSPAMYSLPLITIVMGICCCCVIHPSSTASTLPNSNMTLSPKTVFAMSPPHRSVASEMGVTHAHTHIRNV